MPDLLQMRTNLNGIFQCNLGLGTLSDEALKSNPHKKACPGLRYSRANYLAEVAGALRELGECRLYVVNFGQWDASCIDFHPTLPTDYAAQVREFVEQFPYSREKLIWMTTNPMMPIVSPNFQQCPPTEWRSPVLLLKYNELSEAIMRGSLPSPFCGNRVLAQRPRLWLNGHGYGSTAMAIAQRPWPLLNGHCYCSTATGHGHGSMATLMAQRPRSWLNGHGYGSMATAMAQQPRPLLNGHDYGHVQRAQ